MVIERKERELNRDTGNEKVEVRGMKVDGDGKFRQKCNKLVHEKEWPSHYEGSFKRFYQLSTRLCRI